MPGEAVVDTSPLQYLHQIGLLGLLAPMFDTVLVPLAVRKELEAGHQAGLDLPVIEDLPWALVFSPQARLAETGVLGEGEAEAISIAKERSALVVLDDREARAIAVSLGLSLTGTLGILIRGKREGLISEIKPVIDELQSVGFRVTDDIARSVLLLAHEAIET